MVIGIIEDDRLLSRSLEITLQKENYQTKCMHTAQEATECLNGTEDLLLIDISLPDGNGTELYQNLAERKFEKKTPAIFLTARDEEQDMLKAFNDFNVIITGIFARKQEFVMMQRIGMTGRQRRKMLLLEGIIYFLVIEGLLITFGTAIIYLISYYMQKKIAYYAFEYPIGWLMGVSVGLFGICLGMAGILQLQERGK